MNLSIATHRRSFTFILAAVAAAIFSFTTPISAERDRSSGSEGLRERQLRELVRDGEAAFEGSRRLDGTYDESLLQRRVQGLINRWEQFLGTYEDFAPAYYAYSQLLGRAGEDELALAMLMHANRLDPEIPYVKNDLGNHLARQGQYPEALAYYIAAIDLDPEESRYHFHLANLLLVHREDFIEDELFLPTELDERMIEAYKAAVRNSPDEIFYAHRLAVAYFDLKNPDWDEALEAWERVAQLAGNPQEKEITYIERAAVCVRKEDFEGAVAWLDKVTDPLLGDEASRIRAQIPRS